MNKFQKIHHFFHLLEVHPVGTDMIVKKILVCAFQSILPNTIVHAVLLYNSEIYAFVKLEKFRYINYNGILIIPPSLRKIRFYRVVKKSEKMTLVFMLLHQGPPFDLRNTFFQYFIISIERIKRDYIGMK